MLIDSRDIDPDQVVHYDLCVIGAGAAGITLARALKSKRLSVCLLESGGFAFDQRTQSLYRGESKGPVLDEDRSYLWTSRLRYFGGTTNHWTGWCRPLDDPDFAKRPWVPHSGWPITRAQLTSYYAQAAAVVQIRPFDDERDEGRGGEELAILHNESIVTKRFHYSPPTRFGKVYRDELVEAENITVLLHANVIGIETNEIGSRVSSVRVTTLAGK